MKCFLCGNKAKKRNFCYGCKVLICSDCDSSCDIVPGGSRDHSPLDHLKCGSCNHSDKASNLPVWVQLLLDRRPVF